MTSGTADSWSVAVLVIRCQLATTLGKAETLPLRRQQNSGGRYNRHDQIENELFYAAEIERRFEAVNYNCRQTIKQPPGKCERGQSKKSRSEDSLVPPKPTPRQRAGATARA